MTELSPLMQALYEGDPGRAEALRHPQLDVFEAAALGDVERPGGGTVLEEAQQVGDPDLAALLREHGADR